MSEERIIIEKKEPVRYARFGTCQNCRSEIAVIGTCWDIEDYTRATCPNCGRSTAVLLGALHKINGWYAKRKLRKVDYNDANKGNRE